VGVREKAAEATWDFAVGSHNSRAVGTTVRTMLEEVVMGSVLGPGAWVEGTMVEIAEARRDLRGADSKLRPWSSYWVSSLWPGRHVVGVGIYWVVGLLGVQADSPCMLRRGGIADESGPLRLWEGRKDIRPIDLEEGADE
jgi:hypothetical protein